MLEVENEYFSSNISCGVVGKCKGLRKKPGEWNSAFQCWSVLLLEASEAATIPGFFSQLSNPIH